MLYLLCEVTQYHIGYFGDDAIGATGMYGGIGRA
jgi:hypothetical protein